MFFFLFFKCATGWRKTLLGLIGEHTHTQWRNSVTCLTHINMCDMKMKKINIQWAWWPKRRKMTFFFLFAVDHPWTALYMTIEAFNEELMRLSELLVIHIHFTSNKSNDGLNISHSKSFFFISRRWSMITTFIQVFSRAPLFHRSHWFPCDIFRSTRCIQCETTFLQLFDGNIEIKNFFPFPFHFQYGNTQL